MKFLVHLDESSIMRNGKEYGLSFFVGSPVDSEESITELSSKRLVSALTPLSPETKIFIVGSMNQSTGGDDVLFTFDSPKEITKFFLNNEYERENLLGYLDLISEYDYETLTPKETALVLAGYVTCMFRNEFDQTERGYAEWSYVVTTVKELQEKLTTTKVTPAEWECHYDVFKPESYTL
jgi:hypothetical protein